MKVFGSHTSAPLRVALPVLAILACASDPDLVDPATDAPPDAPPGGAAAYVAAPRFDPDMGIRAGAGAGPLRFGMQAAEIIDALGLPARRVDNAFDYGDRAMTLLSDVDHGLDAILLGGWVSPDAEYLQRFGGQTPSGVGLLSTAEDVRRAWGEPWLTRRIERADLEFDILWFEQLSGWVALRGNQVVYIALFAPEFHEALKKNPAAGMP